ncbi:response regulator [bacterium]|nr:response regulator [bacterium]
MTHTIDHFGATARGLAKNPLRIIALFIVLIYGFAAFVTAFSRTLSLDERLPLIYFMVFFPVLVLIVFTWLVIRHAGKLYGPEDFRDEDNYVRTQLAAAASLGAATARSQKANTNEDDFSQLVDLIRLFPKSSKKCGKPKCNRLLWVDDQPELHIYIRKAFEAVGISFKLAHSLNEALQLLRTETFSAIIADIGNDKEGPREGYILLDAVRRQGDKTPIFMYTGEEHRPEEQQEAVQRGAQASANNPKELFKIVMDSLIKRD